MGPTEAPVISGTYYVTGGENTPLEFEDPRACSRVGAGVKWFHQGAIQIAPSHTGTFVLFPSWLRHRVRGHTGQKPRISISFNLVVPNMLDVTNELTADQRRKELLLGGQLRMHSDAAGPPEITTGGGVAKVTVDEAGRLRAADDRVDDR